MSRAIVRCALAFLFLSPHAAVAQAQVDGVRDGIARGAAAGSLAGLALGAAQLTSCDVGCEASGSTAAILLGWAVLGAAAGSAVGLAADYDAQGPRMRLPQVTAGFRLLSTGPTARALGGRATAPAATVAVRLSPRLGLQAEYLAIDTAFTAARGAIAPEVLDNVVPAETRIAGRSHGLESRRVRYVFSELLAFRVPAGESIALALLGGVGVQAQEERRYYEAYDRLPDGRTERLPGRYSLLDFASPEVGPVVGADVAVTLKRRLALLASVRYHGFGDSASTGAGGGVQWRF